MKMTVKVKKANEKTKVSERNTEKCQECQFDKSDAAKN